MLYQGPAMTQPSDQRRLAVAEYVARSAGRSCSMAKAFAIGFPAFMSEFRTAIATITVHRMGLNPRTTRNGMLAPCTRTTEPTFPKRLARAGWTRMAIAVPRLVMAKTTLRAARSSPNLPSMKTLRKGITCPAPRAIRKPGISSRQKVRGSAGRGILSRAERRPGAGPPERAAMGSPVQASPGRCSSVRQSRRRRGRSSRSASTVSVASPAAPAMMTIRTR